MPITRAVSRVYFHHVKQSCTWNCFFQSLAIQELILANHLHKNYNQNLITVEEIVSRSAS